MKCVRCGSSPKTIDWYGDQLVGCNVWRGGQFVIQLSDEDLEAIAEAPQPDLPNSSGSFLSRESA